MHLSVPIQLSRFRLRAIRLNAKIVALLLLLVGLATYATGLSSPFMGDDNDQIISNTTVHSLRHLDDIYGGSTFFDGSAKSQLTGVYYRPLMMTAFAVIYSTFGPHPLAFHLFQLLLFIFGALMVFLVLKRFVKPGWGLAAALIFLVHPLNSQSVFSIATLQDTLYFALGMTGFWLMVRFRSRQILLASAACLFLSLLSKETGVVFIGLSFIYLLIYDRRRLLPFTAGAVLVFAAYLALKIHAVGFIKPNHIAPIDDLSLPARAAMIPALIVHYLGLAVLPLRLASNYYFVYPLSLGHFWVPLMLIISLLLSLVYLGFELHRRANHRRFIAYVFFIIWAILGLLPHLQLISLDMTACDTWFYVSMVGTLGAACVLGETYLRTVSPKWLLSVLVVVVLLLATRTALRGLDWDSPAALAVADLKAYPDNFVAEYQLAINLKNHGDLKDAETLARGSTQTYANGTNLDVLGQVLTREKKYAEAKQTFDVGMKVQAMYELYQDEAFLSILSADPSIGVNKLQAWSKSYPDNPTIWTAIAVASYRQGNVGQAQAAITTARRLNPGNSTISGIYRQIVYDQPLILR